MKTIGYLGRSAAMLGVAVLLGCGGGDDGREPVYKVTGKVTYQGGPLVGAAVSFSPSGEGPAAAGITDENGQYTLTTYAKDDGAAAGRYGVSVTKYEGGEEPDADAGAVEAAKAADELDPTDPNWDEYGEGYDEAAAGEAPQRENILPVKYAHHSTSELTAEVTTDEEQNVFDFEIAEE